MNLKERERFEGRRKMRRYEARGEEGTKGKKGEGKRRNVGDKELAMGAIRAAPSAG